MRQYSGLEWGTRGTGVTFSGHEFSCSRTTEYDVVVADAVTKHHTRIFLVTLIAIGETPSQDDVLELRAGEALDTKCFPC